MPPQDLAIETSASGVPPVAAAFHGNQHGQDRTSLCKTAHLGHAVNALEQDRGESRRVLARHGSTPSDSYAADSLSPLRHAARTLFSNWSCRALTQGA
jgi:hypothetical protein